MTPFGLLVEWDNPAPPRFDPARLIGPVLEFCGDGSAVAAVPGAVAAVAVRAIVSGEDASSALVLDRARRRLVVGDVRLYDRESLEERVGGGGARATDLELLLGAFDRFGASCLRFLVGDFAFVMWDWAERRLWAARDHFGIRPLHVLETGRGMVLASDVRQLLPVYLEGGRSLASEDIDPRSALTYLHGGRARRDRTYFRAIEAVAPGHALEARAGAATRVERYWHPPPVGSRHARSYPEWVEEWRSLFRAAVRDRLRCAYPVAVHVSGGLDAGSIAGAAHDILSASRAERVDVTALSAFFPGLDCDESAQIAHTLARNPRFATASWDGLLLNHEDFDRPRISRPGFHGAAPTSRWADMELARARGARVLLAGDGGDEMGWSRGIFRDLLARGAWWRLARELMTFKAWARRRAHGQDALWGALPLRGGEEWCRDSLTKLAGPPEWLGPASLAQFPDALVGLDAAPAEEFGSHLQKGIWRSLCGPASYYMLDARVLAGFEAGVEVREPYLDVRLANLTLAIPSSFRLPRGDMRRLQREAAGIFLAPAVRDKIRKTTFESAVLHQLRGNLSRVRALLESRSWLSENYVDQIEARHLLWRCALAETPGNLNMTAYLVLRMAAFEAWLRGLSGYHAPERGPNGNGTVESR